MNPIDVLSNLEELAHNAESLALEEQDETQKFLLLDLSNNISNLVEEFKSLLA